MKIRNLLILGLVLLGFTYCSSDEVLDGPTPGSGETADNLKMEIAIKMPTGASTRSKTGATGTEAGTTEENKPNSVLIVLVEHGTDIIAGTYSSTDTNGGHSGATFFTTAQFTMENLKADAKFDVYAFVNPYDGLLDNYPKSTEFDKDAHFNKTEKSGITTVAGLIDAVTKKSETRNNFFMSNADEVQTVTVEATHIQGAPLKVGINVQRAVARMDYVAKKVDDVEVETYKIAESDVTVKFIGYKVINTSKSFYDLKRVNNGATINTDIPVIGGVERADNYVVDTDWAKKQISWDSNTNPWSAGFFNYMGSVSTVSDALAFKALSEKSYVTENTIPKSAENKKGIATAVVFKGYLKFDVDSYITVKDDVKNDDYVYVWNNKFYGSFDNLPAGIQAIGKGNNTDLASAGVTGYAKDTDNKYPIYYVYYNVHNQNDSKSEVGPMEFGVVRNNIYRLTINNLSKFGHPNDPELVYDPETSNPDPNPEKPEDPIKSSELYMQVTATVLDWTVRTNEIEF